MRCQIAREGREASGPGFGSVVGHTRRLRNNEEHRLEAYATLGVRRLERCLKGYFTGEIYGTHSDMRWASVASAQILSRIGSGSSCFLEADPMKEARTAAKRQSNPDEKKAME